MIILIDNYDSFTYNLYQLIGNHRQDIKVIRNDELGVEEIQKLEPECIIISPGPGNPEKSRDFGICRQVILELGDRIPILGICLGHQGIFNAFGGNIVPTEPVHGKNSSVEHNQNDLFCDVPNPLPAIRYHSLVCQEETLPDCLEITARTLEGIIMGIKHKKNPIFGLQFHPESVGTEEGSKIIGNFLEMLV
ncbi:MAG: aminodeoxychorismate/anthranilate synthase component II [Methanobacteriales archaeon Met13]